MTRRQVAELQHGLYLLRWKKCYGGGSSLAAVGSLYDGTRWFAPTNWTGRKGDDIASTSWSMVQSVKLVETIA